MTNIFWHTQQSFPHKYVPIFFVQVYYTLNVGGFYGHANDALSAHNGYRFSTYDNDQDGWPGNCAVYSPGGWWYVNLNT